MNDGVNLNTETSPGWPSKIALAKVFFELADAIGERLGQIH